MSTENLLFWTAVALYGLGAVAYIFAFIARSEKLFTAGLAFAAVGFLPHTAAIALRWIDAGVNPFITIAESLTLGVWMSILLYLLVQLATKKVRALGVLVMPVAFALLGWGGTLRTASTGRIAPALQSGWLWIHIIGASAGFGAVLIAAALGLLFLLKGSRQGRHLRAAAGVEGARRPELPVRRRAGSRSTA